MQVTKAILATLAIGTQQNRSAQGFSPSVPGKAPTTNAGTGNSVDSSPFDTSNAAQKRDYAARQMSLKGTAEAGDVPQGLNYISEKYAEVSVKDVPAFLYPNASASMKPAGEEALRTLRPDLDATRLADTLEGVQVQSTPRKDGGAGFESEFNANLEMVRSHPGFTTFAGEEIANVQPQKDLGTPSIYEMSFKDDQQALHNHPYGARMLVIHTGNAPAGVSFGGVRSPEDIKSGDPIDLVLLDFDPNSTILLAFPAGMTHAFSGQFFAQSIHADDGKEVEAAKQGSGLVDASVDDPELMTTLSVIAAPEQRVDTGDRISIDEFNLRAQGSN